MLIFHLKMFKKRLAHGFRIKSSVHFMVQLIGSVLPVGTSTFFKNCRVRFKKYQLMKVFSITLTVRPSTKLCFRQNHCSWVGSTGRLRVRNFMIDVEYSCLVTQMKHRLFRAFINDLKHKRINMNYYTQHVITMQNKVLNYHYNLSFGRAEGLHPTS